MLFLFQGGAAPGQGGDILGTTWWADAPKLKQPQFLLVLCSLEKLDLRGSEERRINSIVAKNDFRGNNIALRRNGRRPLNVPLHLWFGLHNLRLGNMRRVVVVLRGRVGDPLGRRWLLMHGLLLNLCGLQLRIKSQVARKERHELIGLYEAKGLPAELAAQVADALVAHEDPLRVHAREELRLDPDDLARPLQAAVVSALSFAVGAALPLAVFLLVPAAVRVLATLGGALVALALLGGWSARLGRAPVGRALGRVVLGGALAMGLTYGLGAAFGAAP